MKQSTPSQSPQGVPANLRGRLTKFSILSAAIASIAAPLAQAAGPDIIVEMNTLTIASSGVLNLKNNALLIHTGNIEPTGDVGSALTYPSAFDGTGIYPTLAGYIQSGAAVGAFPNVWTGPGISSSVANAADLNAFGPAVPVVTLQGVQILINDIYIDVGFGLQHLKIYGGVAGVDSFYGPFYGKTNLLLTDILVRTTWWGDMDLNGIVDGTDYGFIDTAFNINQGTPAIHTDDWLGMQNGDLDMNGVIDGTDYSLIDTSYNLIAANGGGPLLSPSSASVVPEPTSFCMLAVGALGLLLNRRRSL